MKPFDLINWFWRKQRAHSIGSDGISLFFYLLQHCNDAEWEQNPFELRIENIRATLLITEERIHTARLDLQKAGIVKSLAQFGRGKAYIFYITYLPVQSEHLYRLLMNAEENPAQKGNEKGSQKDGEKGMQKGNEKEGVKGYVKGYQKEKVKGAEKDPFSLDYSPPFSPEFSPPFSDTFSGSETASNGHSSLMEDEEILTSILPLKTGGEEEEEDEEDTNYLPLTRTREEVQSVSAQVGIGTKRQPSKPTALDQVLTYAEQQRMRGKVMATALLAEKFWVYYEETAQPAWHVIPKDGSEPMPVSDWRKKFNDWELTEREQASKRPPPYSLNVNDIPHELRSISNFNDVWSDYLNQCATMGNPHDQTSARYALQNLVFRQKQGEKALEILTNAIRNQRKDFWSQHGNNTRNNSGKGSSSTAAGRGRTQRKPQLSPGNSGTTQKDVVTFS